MAKTKTAVVRYLPAPRPAAPIIVRPRAARPAKKHHKGHKRGQSTEKVITGLLIGGFVLGYLDKPDSKIPIPTVPALGKAGTIAVVAHFLGKGRGGYLTDVRNAAAAIFAYEYGKDGKVSGVDGDEGRSGHV